MAIQDLAKALRGWARNTKRAVDEDGVAGAVRSGRHLVFGSTTRALQAVGKVANYGDHVFEDDWDLLVLLDGCRADVFDEVVGEYDRLAPPESRYSIASGSSEWMEKTFTDEYADVLCDVAYVTGNPFSARNDLSALGTVEEVWKYAWDEERGTIQPRPITDRAIELGRERDFDRTIVHYMQPHYPFVPEPIGSGIDVHETGGERDTVWAQLRSRQLDADDIWRAYRKNLEYVLDDVTILLDNFDAPTTVLSSDHGNAFGEWGVYGHLNYVPAPAVKRVPWSETTATDAGEHDPVDHRSEGIATDVENRLADLGYV